MAEKNRCKACGQIYAPTEKKCPECGSEEKSKIALPDPYWES